VRNRAICWLLLRETIRGHMRALLDTDGLPPAYGTYPGVRYEQWADTLRWMDEIERGEP
jgi:hypothetical protein